MNGECPKGKFAFDSFEQAQKARRTISQRAYREGRKFKYETGQKPPKVKVRVYICPECGKWHVGRGAPRAKTLIGLGAKDFCKKPSSLEMT
jgi:ribosomal protein L44E